MQQLFGYYKLQSMQYANFRIHLLADSNYPCQLIEQEDCVIAIDGHLYGSSAKLIEEIKTLAKACFKQQDYGPLQHFVAHTDGEYIIAIVDKLTQSLLVFNDFMGRLPFYYYQQEGRSLLSRDISFITHNTQATANKQGITQSLLLGFTLNENSLHQGISKLLPGQALLLTPAHNIQLHSTYSHCFAPPRHHSTPPKAQQAAQLFLSACQARYQQGQGIALSGGLDSRAVLAALHGLYGPQHCFTYSDSAATATADIAVAQKLSSLFKSPWQLITLPPHNEESSQQLISIKQGLNYEGMAFILPFLQQIRGKYKGQWTGDGGDKVLPDLRPLRPLFSMSDLVNYIYHRHHILSYKEIEQAVGIKKKEIKAMLRTHLEAYPEKKLSHKYARFIMMQRGVNWLFEGEDRNRHYLESITPFYSIAFYQYCMAIPWRHKKNFKFFKAFLHALHPALLRVENANWQCKPADSAQLRYLYFKQKVKTWLQIALPLHTHSQADKTAYLSTINRIFKNLTL